MTTKEWLQEYLDYCEGLKQKNKPKGGLLKEKISDLVPEIGKEQQKKLINVKKPEIIQNFWTLLFNKAKYAVLAVLKSAGFRKLLGEKLQNRLITFGEEIKLVINSLGELSRFINDWLIEKQPRIKIRQMLAGFSVILAIFGFLLFVTKSDVQGNIGNNVANLAENGWLISETAYKGFNGKLDGIKPAFLKENIILSIREIGQKFSWHEVSEKTKNALISVQSWLPEKSGQFGIAILEKKDEAKKAPDALQTALKNSFKKNVQSLAIAGRMMKEKFEFGQNNFSSDNLRLAIYESGQKFFKKAKTLSASIQDEIFGTRKNIADIALGIGRLINGISQKFIFATQIFEEKFSYLVFGKPYPDIPSLVILRKTRLGISPEQKAEIIKEVSEGVKSGGGTTKVISQTEVARLTEKVTEITRITERVESADLTVLEARMLVQISDVKSSILQSLSSLTNAQINNHVYTWAPAQRIDTLGQVTINGLQWPGDKGTAGQVLTTNGTGLLYWSTIVAGGGSTGAGWTDDGTVVRLTEISDYVGIGTTSPYAMLSVAGQAVVEYLTATSTTATSTFAWGIQTNLLNILLPLPPQQLPMALTFLPAVMR